MFHTRRVLLISLSVTVGLIILVSLGFWSVYLPADYPGATNASSSTSLRYAPSLVIRRISTYRTNDPFPKVYNWYSQRFDLGPEQYAQGGCILMGRTFTTLWV
jgi:hypothetical protein